MTRRSFVGAVLALFATRTMLHVVEPTPVVIHIPHGETWLYNGDEWTGDPATRILTCNMDPRALKYPWPERVPERYLPSVIPW